MSTAENAASNYKMPEAGTEPKPYPYPIPRVTCPDDETCRILDLWRAQEFFRIELLLRSEVVMNLYRTLGSTLESSMILYYMYDFTWEALDGWHHCYLKPRTGPTTGISGFSTLSLEQLLNLFELLHKVLAEQDAIVQRETWARLQKRFLGLLVDPALPPDTVLEAISPVIEQRHRDEKPAELKKPHKFGIKTWLDYLACYDLRTTKGLPYAQIAQTVYGKCSPTGERIPTKRPNAKTAVKRVRKFMSYAEHRDWPPPSLGDSAA